MAAEGVVRRLATVVAILCATVLALTAAAAALPSVRERLGLVPTRPPSYSPGDLVDVPAGLYSGSALTLLLFIRSDCSACLAAKPALVSLVADLSARAVPTRVLVSGARVNDERQYTKDLGLGPEDLVMLPLPTLRAKVVPTLVLVSQRGEVVHAVEGRPGEVQQRALLEAAVSTLEAR